MTKPYASAYVRRVFVHRLTCGETKAILNKNITLYFVMCDDLTDQVPLTIMLEVISENPELAMKYSDNVERAMKKYGG